MVRIDLLAFEIEFGLFPVAEGAEGLTLILFVALSLLATLGTRFAYYAHRNMVRSGIEIQARLWVLLRSIGVLAAVFGAVGLLEIVSSLTVAGKDGLLLAMTLLLALSLRQIYLTASGSADLLSPRLERAVRVVSAAVVLLYVALATITGQTTVTAAVEGTSAVGFMLYGGTYFRTHVSRSRLQGTMLDSLVRHLLPVLTFAALAGIVTLAVPLGVSRLVVLHIQVVFVIMTATSLMTATIKLRQNLATL